MIDKILPWIVWVFIIVVVIYYIKVYILTHKLPPFLLMALANLYALSLRLAIHIESQMSESTKLADHWSVINFPIHILNALAVIWLYYALYPIYHNAKEIR